MSGLLGTVAQVVLEHDLISGHLAVAGDPTGYGHTARARAVDDAATLARAERALRRPLEYVVVQLADPQAAPSLPGRWLWVAETAYRGDTWSVAELESVIAAGVTEGPAQSSAAAAFLLEEHLARLALVVDEYDVEDDWWRVSVWSAGRPDETLGRLGTARLEERAAGMSATELTGLTYQLQAARISPDAVSVATPRQVALTVSDVLRLPSGRSAVQSS